MKEENLIPQLAEPEKTRLVLLVMDGLGGLPHPDTGLTELETAATPNLDRLAGRSTCGLIHPVAPGVTPGSGPGHMALFGYDPREFMIGRGILSAMGIGLEVGPGEVAARVNFCTIENGVVTDRRAGRISTETNSELCRMIREKVQVDGLDFTIMPEKDHRAALVLRGKDLSDGLTDSDPEKAGLPVLPVRPRDPADEKAVRTAELVNRFLAGVEEALAGQSPANMILTRGYTGHPRTPSMQERYKLNPAAIATYPMYRGLARLVGMEVLETGDTFEQEIGTLRQHWESHDFFFLHYKKTDSAGEDGDFARKAACISEVDELLPRILELRPDVLAITGDHSTPAVLKGHSWHPCPLILHSPWEITGGTERFSERECARGGLGIFDAVHLMSLMLANGRRLAKFGA
jgi:2,3-bisphosphoglycerate-independent phosphoglycerate mutase